MSEDRTIMPIPAGPRHQLEDAAFWVIEREKHGRPVEYRTPVDRRAVYGHPVLGDREPDEMDVPVRTAMRDLRTAIRTLGERRHLKLHHEDRVRVNDGNWMEVIQRSDMADEGFMCVPENGEKLRVIEPYHGKDIPPGTWDLCWMHRVDGWVSEGEVGCLEVDWADEKR